MCEELHTFARLFHSLEGRSGLEAKTRDNAFGGQCSNSRCRCPESLADIVGQPIRRTPTHKMADRPFSKL